MPNIVIDAVSNKTLCANSTSSQILFNSNVSGVKYKWFNSNTNIGLVASGSGVGIPTFTATNNSNVLISSQVTAIPYFVNKSDTCYGNAITFIIEVLPLPNVTKPNDQVICNGAPTAAVVFNSSPFITGTSFAWSNTNPSIGLGSNGTGNIPSFLGVNPINLPSPYSPITGTINITPSITLNALTCYGDIKSFMISVLPTPDVTARPLSQLLCGGSATGAVNFNTNAAGGGTVNYTWSTPTNIGASNNPITGTGNLNQFVTNINLTSVTTANYVVVPTYSLNNVNCSGDPLNFKITVVPTPDLQDPQNQIVCNGDPTASVVFQSNVLNTDYVWFNNNITTGLNANGTGSNIPTFIGQNTSNVTNTSSINVTPSFTAQGLTCMGITENFTITVNPTPDVTVITNSSQVLCPGTNTLPIQFNGSVANTTYYWTNDNPTIGLATKGTGNIASFVALNSSNITQIANLVVTPVYFNGDSCAGQPQTFTIIVNPKPILSNPGNQVKCLGEAVSPIKFNNTVSGTVINWSNTNSDIGLPISGTGDIATFAAANPFNYPITGTVSAIPVYTNQGVSCSGNPQNFTITVNPIPTMTDPADQVVCNFAKTQAINFTSNVIGTTYAWNNSDPSIGLASNGVGNIPAFTASNSTTIPVQASLTVQSAFTNLGHTCIGNSQNINITVNPTATLLNSDVTICSNHQTNTTIIPSIPATISWIANSNPNVSGETSTPAQTTSLINDFLINAGNTAETVTYAINFVSLPYNCPSGPFTLDIIVNPLPKPQFNVLNVPTCTDVPIEFVNTTNGNNFYAWDFGDGSASNDQNSEHSYPNVGIYEVTLVATEQATGCVDSISKQLNLLQSPAVGFTVSNTAACEFASVIFRDTVNAANTSLSWQFGDGGFSSESSYVDHQYTEDGCFDISLTVTSTNGCIMSDTIKEMLCVYEAPIADFTTDKPTYFDDDALVTINNMSLNASSYVWDFGDGDSSVAMNPIHAFDGIGEYKITLFAYNAAGCYDSSIVTIKVVNDVLIYVPNTITVNQDGINEKFLPVLGEAFLKETYHLSIFNRWGKLVFESYNYEVGWDGYYADHFTSQDGTYTWMITVKIRENEDYLKYVGHVNVLNGVDKR